MRGSTRRTLAHPDYLFVSHLHHDHFDPDWLHEHVSKDATVLLPDFPADAAGERAARLRLHQVHADQELAVDPVERWLKDRHPRADQRPRTGRSATLALIVDDGEMRIFNQNDSRPIDLDARQPWPVRRALPPVLRRDLVPDGLPLPREDDARARPQEARERDGPRAALTPKRSAPTSSFPSAGPPCFLDDDLFGFNDFDRDPTNIFPDQTVFLEFIARRDAQAGG